MKFQFLCFIAVLNSMAAVAANEKIVLVSHGGLGNPFWPVVFNGAKEAAKELGVSLQILFPNKDGDQPGTTQKLSEAISTHPQGIAVTLATTAHCEYIREARNAGIPVVIYNSQAAPASTSCPYQAYIGMDEYRAGRISADRALALKRVKGRVMVGLTEAGHLGLQARAKGVTDVMTQAGIKVDTIDLGNDPSQVPARIEGYWKKNKGEVTGMFIPAPNGIHPLMRMMDDDPEGLGKVYSSSFDLTPLIIRAIEKGRLDHTIDQQPYLQGYYAVTQLTMAIRGNFAPMDMNTGVGVVDQTNAARVRKLVEEKIR